MEKGDTIELDLPMSVRRVVAHESVKDDDGKVAFERGPVVYCAEAADNESDVLSLVVAGDVRLTPEFRTDVLGGVVVLKGRALAVASNADGSPGSEKEQDLLLIPYYTWANRGPGEMAVWLKKK